ncbi:hypothetical protein N185_30380 [Sinorhizobium sp. GW3]|nr:hypothetical protein N185_30380 [Sinorhizobium sp. GW3]
MVAAHLFAFMVTGLRGRLAVSARAIAHVERTTVSMTKILSILSSS